MADQLSVKININSADAKNKLANIHKLLRDNDRAFTQLQRTAAKGLSFNSRGATGLKADIDDLGKKTKTATRNMSDMEKNMRKIWGASRGPLIAYGKSMTGIFSTALTQSVALGKNMAAITAAVGGLGAAKSLQGYIGMSQQAGQLNAISEGGIGMTRMLEDAIGRATSGTTSTNAEVADSMLKLASTPMFDLRQYKPGTPDYKKGIDEISFFSRRSAEFAASTGAQTSTVTDAMIKYASVYGKDLKNETDVKDIQDSFKVLMDVSQGGLEYLAPQIAKFAQEAKALGISENEGLAAFATLTNVFGVEEAGTRTSALTRWLSGAGRDVEAFTKATAETNLPKAEQERIAKLYKDALYDENNNRKNFMDSINGVMKILEELPDDMTRDILGGVTFSEIRETGGVRSLYNSYDLLQTAIKEFDKKAGASDKSIESFFDSTGAKIDVFFKTISNAGELSIGALIDVLTSANPDITRFEETLEEMGRQLNFRVGAHASNPLRWLIESIKFISENKTRIDQLGASLQKVAGIMGTIGGKVIDIIISPQAQSLLDFFLSKPEMAIAAAFAAPAVTQAIQAGIVAAFGAAAIPTALATALATAYLASEVQDAMKGKKKQAGDLASDKGKTRAADSRFGNIAKQLEGSNPEVAEYFKKAQEATVYLEGLRSLAEKDATIKSENPLAMLFGTQYKLEMEMARAEYNKMAEQANAVLNNLSPENKAFATSLQSGMVQNGPNKSDIQPASVTQIVKYQNQGMPIAPTAPMTPNIQSLAPAISGSKIGETLIPAFNQVGGVIANAIGDLKGDVSQIQSTTAAAIGSIAAAAARIQSPIINITASLFGASMGGMMPTSTSANKGGMTPNTR